MFDSESHPGARRYGAPHHLPTQRRIVPRPSGRRAIRYAITTAAAAMVALLWAGIWFHLGTVRASDIAKAENTALNLARALEEHMLRTLTAIDQVLLRMRTLYADHPGPFDFVAAMPEAAGALEMAVGAYVAGADGRVIWSSTGAGYGNYIGDREHFTAHAQSREDKVYISRPVTGRVSGRPSIQVTRRISLPDGSFGGIVNVALDPAYLDGFYRSIDLGPHGTTTVFGLDGVVRARSGHEPTRIGQNMQDAPVMRAQRERPEGLIQMNSAFDGLPKLVAYRRLDGFPVVVTVAISESDALSAFVPQQRAVIAAGLAITVLIAGLTLLLVRQLANSDAANGALAASEERYQLLIDGSREGMYDRDFIANRIWFSERAHQILGLSDGVLNGDRTRLLALIHPTTSWSMRTTSRICWRHANPISRPCSACVMSMAAGAGSKPEAESSTPPTARRCGRSDPSATSRIIRSPKRRCSRAIGIWSKPSGWVGSARSFTTRRAIGSTGRTPCSSCAGCRSANSSPASRRSRSFIPMIWACTAWRGAPRSPSAAILRSTRGSYVPTARSLGSIRSAIRASMKQETSPGCCLSSATPPISARPNRRCGTARSATRSRSTACARGCSTETSRPIPPGSHPAFTNFLGCRTAPSMATGRRSHR